MSLGAHQAGFETALAIDADPILSSSFQINFPRAKLLNFDMRNVGLEVLKANVPAGVDGIIGGPPCQAFSEMGRRDVNDPRRALIAEFFRLVALVRPKFFLFENVRGLGFEKNLSLLESGLEFLPAHWKVLGPQVLNAADFGAPTRRHRLFVIGIDPNEMSVPPREELFGVERGSANVRDAISDLATASEAGQDCRGFDLWRYDWRRGVPDYAKKMRGRLTQFTSHKKTEHTKETIKRFSELEPGKNDKIGKYARLSWEGLCPTLRAGTGNDRGSYQAVRPIHPTEHRVITPREAARLQGFPDKFIFHPTVWHSCRMIGNSVSPFVARALLQRVRRHLSTDMQRELLVAAE